MANGLLAYLLCINIRGKVSLLAYRTFCHKWEKVIWQDSWYSMCKIVWGVSRKYKAEKEEIGKKLGVYSWMGSSCPLQMYLFEAKKGSAVPAMWLNGHLKWKNSGHHAFTLGFKGQVIQLKHVLCSVLMQHEIFLVTSIIHTCCSKRCAACLRQHGLDLNT
jgi:hypothetical protein